MAWHYKFYENEQPPGDRKSYAQAEAEARAGKRGLWVDPHPTPPWDFRRGRRGATTDDEQPAGETVTPPPSTARLSEPRPARGAARTTPREPEAETVYVTRTGEKYHRASCQYLRRRRSPVSLSDARQSYAPCSVCRPPE